MECLGLSKKRTMLIKILLSNKNFKENFYFKKFLIKNITKFKFL